jgi:hypothetical protein
MALTITDAGNGNSTSSSASLSTGSTITASVADWLVAVPAADNNGTNGAASLTSVTDSQGNTWKQRALINQDPGAAAAGATLGIYVCEGVTNALSSGTVTANFSPNTASKAIQVYRVQPGAGEVVQFVASDTTGSAGSTTTHSAATVSVTQDDTIIGCAAVETGTPSVTGDSDTTNGSWSTVLIRVANTGTDSTSMNSVSQYKTVTATGNQSWACTTGSARNSARSYLILRAVAAAIDGDLDKVEAVDSLASTGALAIAGSLTKTDASDTISSVGALAIQATASISETGDTLQAEGTGATLGAATITEAGDTVSATGVLPITGALTKTETGDTLSSASTLAIVGSASITETPNTLTSAAALTITGSLTITERSDAVSSIGVLPIFGTASIIEGRDTLSALITVPAPVSAVLEVDGLGILAIATARPTLKIEATTRAILKVAPDERHALVSPRLRFTIEVITHKARPLRVPSNQFGPLKVATITQESLAA